MRAAVEAARNVPAGFKSVAKARRRACGATGAEKKNQTWAPLPERDLSTAAGTQTRRHVSTKALTSSVHVLLSKSTARNQQVSSSSSG